LVRDIEGSEMCNIFKGSSTMTNRLQRFGYINIELLKDCMLGEKGDILNANEFHKSITNIDGEEIYRIKKPMGKRSWSCGYEYKNVLAGYPHIHFFSNMKAFNYLLDNVENNMER